MNIIIAFLAFNFLVLVHELGHFIVAKASGIKVLEFSLFMGPRIFSIKKGDTEYSLRMLPILAYVKMEGEEERSASERAFNKKPLGTRAAVIAAGPLMNLFVAILLITIVFSITGFDTTEVHLVDENSAAFISDIRVGDRITRYDGKRVYKPMEVIQFMYVSEGKPVEVELIRDGHSIKRNLVPEEMPAYEKYMFGFTLAESFGKDSNLLQSVSSGMPAKKAGMKKGDRVVALDGVKTGTKEDIDNFMKTHDGSSISVTVLRNGNEVVMDITPVFQEIPASYYLGMGFSIKEGSVFDALKHSFVYTYTTIRSVGYSLAWLVSGQVSVSQLMGPVGIVNTIGTVVEQSRARLGDLLLNLMNITAMISIALGATNLIPFPALDGNKLLLLAVEGIRRKPIPPEREAFITMIGFALLIMLAVVTFYNDLARIFGG